MKITLDVLPDYLGFFAGLFLTQCFSPIREVRKAAIFNYGALYMLCNDETKDILDKEYNSAQRLANNPEIIEEVREHLIDYMNEIKKRL